MASQFRFQSPDGNDIAPQEWLRLWVELYPEKDYDHEEYRDLIAKHKSLSADDFKRIGKWKDGARTESKWKPNVASVAYPIWLKAASEIPQCPEERGVADFWIIGLIKSTRMILQLAGSKSGSDFRAPLHCYISLAAAASLSSTRG
jgi:hypothetical protein